MRPEIAGLVRSLGLYRTLMDGDNVKCYPDVPGMGGKNLLWLDHKSKESFSGTSYYNIHEADMIAGYAAHLIGSGEFGIRDIVILTPYREQVSVIKRFLQKQGAFGLVIPAEDMSCLVGRNAEYNPPLESESKDFTLINVDISDAVQVTTIDNYQGQEADIILYSAVRSNNTGRLGFTDITNRACVTLSRARHGMYIFGNADTAQNSKNSWNKVIRYMKAHGRITRDLSVQRCSRHTGPVHMIRSPADWRRLKQLKSCHSLCSEVLSCGHVCLQSCHSHSTHLLTDFKCTLPTSATLACGHIADFQCGTRDNNCPDCKRSLVENMPPAVDAIENGCQTTEINIFPLHISELSAETVAPTVASHEEFFLCASRYFLSNADGLENGLQDGKSSREAFLQSLNLSHNGLEENKWKFAGRYGLLKDFQGVYKVGLRQAAIVEREFGSEGLVSRMEGLKQSLGVTMAADFNWILAEMMKRARPHNCAQVFASALRQALQEFFD
ncbi:hypothetical protein P167DRAFT_33642 [Morchella conica CCBAS932]|uniref:DNA2/NAM7 helicase-like C-terminal domain-containing protein n=1 Tax=Morchella conica CCBAS932 TaxID=1392247 RepID=A0A3N4KX20_9PEZI|nr:hypothetical protein P167DRAFT_33642 [Morchella conica CCBAS932]